MDSKVLKEKKKSLVWRFFKKPLDKSIEKVKCPSCSDSVVYKGTTSGLMSHLTRRHKSDYAKIVKSSQLEESEEKNTQKGSAEILLAKSFATGLIPFKFSENPEFRLFLNSVAPDFKAPNGSKIKNLVDESYAEHLDFLQNKLKNVNKFSMMTDGYSDQKRNIHVYSLHVSFLDEDFDRQILFCGLRSVSAGDNVSVASVLTDIMDDVGLRMSKCSAMCSDAGSPLVLMAEKHGFDRVHCGCHLLNLIIRDFAEEKVVKKKHAHIANFARFLSRNKEEKEKLAAMTKQNGVQSCLPLPLPATRWGALHTLFNQYLEVYDSAKDLSKLKEFLVKPSELEVIKEIRDLVKPVHECILRLEKDTSSTSEIIPALVFIKDKTERTGSVLSSKLLSLIKNRLDASMENRRILCSMLLDHRFAYNKKYIQPLSWDIVEIYLEFYDENEEIDDPNDSVEMAEDDNDNFDSFLSSGYEKTSKKCDIKDELLKYRALLATNRPSYQSPITFWKGHKDNFPRLSSIASNLLATPGSSAVSERTFRRKSGQTEPDGNESESDSDDNEDTCGSADKSCTADEIESMFSDDEQL
ncbi:hypothetical protein CAEBREN_16464 [Caenorhabditis brenneri]|uniref:BED-type domain-containing protein n=1 Tax=Caenorhabditis brenneri TaxID=135651 RepID=G0NCZ0_CAEBE|nr:hypothetical protein CAEBREN_16464 [Caenorhabditis brenneri]